MYKLQSIIFDKNLYSLEQCINWIKDNGFSLIKVDETKNYYRFRQASPNFLIKNGYDKVVTKEIHNGIKFILYYNEPQQINGGDIFKVVNAVGHSLGQAHPASKYGLNPYDIGYKIGLKLGEELYKSTHKKKH